ncbi:Retrovirus-related Pol polyprotein from transposon 412 [Includes: Protease [Durusdinium trenchii]|uniref:Retrovirus-related Pol polyprotein from transposon 412 n=1 Tax=Durusdinium trenchii TaxID=1381693 RepID=A0ABP0IUK5_9DINO
MGKGKRSAGRSRAPDKPGGQQGIQGTASGAAAASGMPPMDASAWDSAGAGDPGGGEALISPGVDDPDGGGAALADAFTGGAFPDDGDEEAKQVEQKAPSQAQQKEEASLGDLFAQLEASLLKSQQASLASLTASVAKELKKQEAKIAALSSQLQSQRSDVEEHAETPAAPRRPAPPAPEATEVQRSKEEAPRVGNSEEAGGLLAKSPTTAFAESLQATGPAGTGRASHALIVQGPEMPRLQEGFSDKGLAKWCQKYVEHAHECKLLGAEVQPPEYGLSAEVISDLTARIRICGRLQNPEGELARLRPRDLRVHHVEQYLLINERRTVDALSFRNVVDTVLAKAQKVMKRQEDRPSAKVERLCAEISKAAREEGFVDDIDFLDQLGSSSQVARRLASGLITVFKPEKLQVAVNVHFEQVDQFSAQEVLDFAYEQARKYFDQMERWKVEEKQPNGSKNGRPTTDAASNQENGNGKKRGSNGGGRENSGDQGNGSSRELPVVKNNGVKCVNCSGDHPFLRYNKEHDTEGGAKFVRNCPKPAKKEELKNLKDKFHEERKKAAATKQGGSGSSRNGKSQGMNRHVDATREAASGEDGEQWEIIPAHLFTNNASPSTHSADLAHVIWENCVADSGASMSFMSHAVLEQLDAQLGKQVRVEPEGTDPSKITTAGGIEYAVEHKVILEVAFDTGLALSCARVPFLVPERRYESETLLFGQDFLLACGVPAIWRQVQQRLQNKHLDVLTGELRDCDTTVSNRGSRKPTEKSTGPSPERIAFARQVRPAQEVQPQHDEDASAEIVAHPLGAKLLLREDSLTEGNLEMEQIAAPFNPVEHDEEALMAALRDVVTAARGEGLPDEYAVKLWKVLTQHRDAFALGFSPGQQPWDIEPWVDPISIEGMRAEALRKFDVHRRYTDDAKRAMKEILDELLAIGKIVPFAEFKRGEQDPIALAPAIMVPKTAPGPDGKRKWRLAWDFRAVNALIRYVPAPIEPVQDVLQRLVCGNPQFFMLADVYRGFWQAPAADSSAALYTLVTPFGNFVSRSVCQGTVNAMTAFIMGIRQTFEGLLHPQGPLVDYVDDLGAGFSTLEAWLEGVHNFLERCVQHKLLLSPKKFKAFAKSIEFLGHQITPGGGLAAKPERLEFLLALNPPRTVADIASVVGIVQYIRFHLKDVHHYLQPLLDLKNALLKNSKRKDKRAMERLSLEGSWNEEHDRAWGDLKRCIGDAIELSFLHQDEELCVFSDASRLGYSFFAAACAPEEMCKAPEDRAYKPLAWYGGRFSDQQVRAWTIPRKELYAVDLALQKFAHMVYAARNVHVYTDHANLIYVIGQLHAGSGSRVMLDAMHRLAVRISQWPAHVHHFAGIHNLHGDFGSRDADRAGFPEARVAQVCAVLASSATQPDEEDDPDADDDAITHVLGDHSYTYSNGFRPAILDPSNILPEGSRRSRRSRRTHAPAAGGENQSQSTTPGVTGPTATDADKPEEEPADMPDNAATPADDPPASQLAIVGADVRAYEKARCAALKDGEFVFPSLKVIQESQTRACASPGPATDEELWLHMPQELPRQDKIEVKENGALRVNKQKTRVKDGTIEVATQKGWRVWLPANDIELHARVIIAAHCGMFGHQGSDATWKTVRSTFYLKKGPDFVAHLVSNCLNCKSIHTKALMPKELGQTLHPRQPGQAIAVDFHTVFTKHAVERGRVAGDDVAHPYLLIIIDLMSGFTKPYPCRQPTSAEAARAVMDYAGTMGLPEWILSDRGSHFLSALFKELTAALGMDHLVAAPRAPWSNGCCERVGSTLKDALAALCSEFRINYSEYTRVLPLVTLFLNSRKLERLNGESPFFLQTGIEPRSPLTAAIPGQGAGTAVTARDLSDAVKKRLEDLGDAIQARRDAAHQKQAEVREFARQRHNDKVHHPAHQIEVGDYVLCRRRARGGAEMTFRWTGPHQVIELEGMHLYKVRHVLTGKSFDVHAQHIVFYADALLNVTEEMRRQAAFDIFAYTVEALGDVRPSDADGTFEMMVYYAGLERTDPTNGFEPVRLLYQSVPRLVRRRLRQLRQEPGGEELVRDIIAEVDPEMRVA